MKNQSHNLLLALDPHWALHLGVARDGERGSYVLVARRGDAHRVLYAGSSLPALPGLARPMPIHADLGATPVTLLCEELRDEEPEAWVDRNEERVIPRGLTADRVVEEWAEHEKRMYAATITKDAHARACETIRGDRFVPASLSVPLWDLARLYSAYIEEPFILLAPGEEGSVVGCVAHGRLQRLLTFWATRREFEADPDRTAHQLTPLCHSLARGDTRIVVVAPSAGGSMEGAKLAIEGFEMVNAPEIEGVAPRYHHAYALARHEPTHLDFAPLDDTHAATLLERARYRALKVARAALAVVVAGAAAVGLAAGALAIAEATVARKLEPVRAEIATLERHTAVRDSLTELLGRKARFIGRESIVTSMLTELQTAFPEEIWAQRIALSEKGPDKWELDILAMAYSTATIPEMMKRLGRIDGVGGIRMLYSEQTKLGRGRNAKKAVRFKVSGEWEQGGGG